MNWEQDDTFLSKWLNDELSEQEKSAFEATDEGKEFIKLMQASTLIEPTPFNTSKEFGKLKERISTSPEAREIKIWQHSGFRLAVAASVALIISVIYVFNLGDTEVSTGYAQQEIVILPDGSEVMLNASSTLSYDADSWEEQRSLNLDGEAFFQVKKGSTFTVETTNGSVQVLGTSFNVKSRLADLAVVCYTGKVEVRSESVIKQLLPGDFMKIQEGELIAFKQKQLLSQPSWMNGITELEDEPLTVVLEELRLIYGLEIKYSSEFNDINYTGSFPNQDVEAALKLVLDPFNIRYTYDPSERVLVLLDTNP